LRTSGWHPARPRWTEGRRMVYRQGRYAVELHTTVKTAYTLPP
jgi:hypothetical protein